MNDPLHKVKNQLQIRVVLMARFDCIHWQLIKTKLKEENFFLLSITVELITYYVKFDINNAMRMQYVIYSTLI